MELMQHPLFVQVMVFVLIQIYAVAILHTQETNVNTQSVMEFPRMKHLHHALALLGVPVLVTIHVPVTMDMLAQRVSTIFATVLPILIL